MSAEVRQALADAANTVEGIDADPYYRQVTTAGHVFIRLDRTDYPNAFGGIVRWNVVLVLPSDLAEGEEYLEDKVPQLRAALADHLTIREVVPQRLSIPGAGDLSCVFITGTREE